MVERADERTRELLRSISGGPEGSFTSSDERIIAAALRKARREGLEACKELATEFAWVLAVNPEAAQDDSTDDRAIAACRKLAAAIQALIDALAVPKASERGDG